MAPSAELAKTGTDACAQPTGGVLRIPVVGRLTAKDRRAQTPEPEDGRLVTIRLGLSFALLIVGLLTLAWWVGSRVRRADSELERVVAERPEKLRLIYEALHYSTVNSRITMQVLVQRSASPDLLASRLENSRRITELIGVLDSRCDSEHERKLLASIKEARRRYLDIHQRALKLLLEKNDANMARDLMLNEGTSALFAYHALWHDLAYFEIRQLQQSAEQAAKHNRWTRHVGLTLQWLAALLTAVIAVFTTSTMGRDLKLRVRMHRKLTDLNSELEERVARRTEELGHAEQQLRESLAETRSYAREIEDVNELAKLLQSCLSLEEARQQASRVLANFFPAGAILIMNSSLKQLEVALRWGEASSREGPFSPESCWGLRKGDVHLAGPHCQNPLCSHCDASPKGCHVCIPMIAQGGASGVLSIDDPSFCGGHRESHLFQRKIKLAHTLAEQISLTFANLTLRETLKYQSVRDPLTGLFNRRHMEEALNRELRRAARKATTIAVLMIDIDHFKHFNDAHGHEAGDLVLREFGLLLRLQVRGDDIACRYGGEEFLLIMGETDLTTACQRAETLRQRVAAMPVHYRGQTLPAMTISIGVSEFPTHGNSAAELVSAADAALYRAKHEGRDRVLVAT